MIAAPIPQWAIDLAMELEKVYPAIDVERARYARNKLLKFEERVARQAVTEYIERSGDEYFNLGKLLAVAHRVGCQLNEGPNSVKEQSIRRELEMRERTRLASAWDTAEAFVVALPESKQRAYRDEFLAFQTDSLRRMYAGMFERGKLPKTFVAAVYEKETARRVEAISAPVSTRGGAPAVHGQRDPFADEGEG